MAEELNFGLADALSDAMESTIEADSSAATRCCDIIREYAYGYPSGNDNGKFGKLNTGNSTSLTMAKFTMKAADGTLQEVQIPQITMMPLPLLHVKEASFEFDLNMEVAENTNVELQSTENKEEVTNTRDPRAVRAARRSNANGKAAFIFGVRATAAKQNSTTNDSSTTSSQNTTSSQTHIKATIRMEQADLPAGIKTLLQAAANSLTINDKE